MVSFLSVLDFDLKGKVPVVCQAFIPEYLGRDLFMLCRGFYSVWIKATVVSTSKLIKRGSCYQKCIVYFSTALVLILKLETLVL